MLRTGVMLALTALIAAPRASASEPEVFGLGSEESAVAGASAARVHDFSAGYYNPAGLTLARRAEASFGVIGFGSALPLPDGRTFHMSNRVGILVGAGDTGAVHRRARRSHLVRHRAASSARHHRARHRAHARSSVLPALRQSHAAAGHPARRRRRVWRGLSVGLAFNYLAGPRRQRRRHRRRDPRARSARRRADLLEAGGQRRRALAARPRSPSRSSIARRSACRSRPWRATTSPASRSISTSTPRSSTRRTRWSPASPVRARPR